MSGVNPLELSDDEFLNMNGPTQVEEGVTENVTPPTTEGEIPGAEAVATTEGGEAIPTEVAGGESTVEGEPDPEEHKQPIVSGEPKATEPAPTEEAAPAEKPAEPAPSEQVIAPEKAVEFYNQIMKPFKANGKMIELRSPEEAVGLMQMGANYTRKLQEIAPHRKTLIMLQNNGLDHDKLSFLIDLDKGDPEAVKKFIKDRGIDPLDIDTSTDPAYLGGNHQVTDEEVAFRTVLEELRSTPEGSATLKEVNDRWDTASKELLWKHPDLLEVIQEQRSNGVYDAISAEIDRRRTLGKLSANVTFMDAYKLVGDELYAPRNPTAGTAPTAQEPQVLATRPATPKPSVSNNDKVTAAAPSRGTAAKPQDQSNPASFLAMSDDDFLKQMKDRV